MLDRWIKIPTLVVYVTLTTVFLTPLSTLAQQRSLTPDRDQAAMLSDQLIVLAKQILGSGESLREDQLVRASILLDLATQLAPDDSDLWRLRLELAVTMQDLTAQGAALKQYCRLQPTDDAALLNLIHAKLGRYQTVDQRLAATGKILDNTAATRFSQALRSRLSSYAAVAAQELGDYPQAKRRMRDAIALDQTNLHAAEVVANWVQARDETARDMGQALMQIVAASPFAAAPRAYLAQWLVSQGAYHHSTKQFDVWRRLATQPPDLELLYHWTFALAADGRTADAMEMIRQLRQSYQQVAQSQPAETPTTSPLSEQLPFEFALLQWGILQTEGQSATETQSFNHIQTAFQQRIRNGDDQAEIDWAWFEVLFAHEQAIAAPRKEQIQRLLDSLPPEDPLVARLRGWLHLILGEAESARAVFESTANRDPFAALGMARLAAKVDPQPHQQWLHKTVEMAPSSIAGLMATRELSSLGATTRTTPVGAAVIKKINRWPSMLASPDLSRHPCLDMNIRFTSAKYRYLEPIVAIITLRNLTGVPLSLGPDGSIPTRLMIFITPRKGGQASGNPPPQVVDLSRKLRLKPREMIRVSVRLDRGDLGPLLGLTPLETLSLGVTAMLDPRPTADGQIVPGPRGKIDTVFEVQRRGLPPTLENIKRWIDALDDPSQSQRWAAAARLILIVSQITPNQDSAKDSPEILKLQTTLEEVAESINRYYQQADAIGQAWVIRFMATIRGTERFRPIHELAQRSDIALVRTVYLATQVYDPQSTVITEAIRHDDPYISTFAKNLKTALKHAAEQDEGGL